MKVFLATVCCLYGLLCAAAARAEIWLDRIAGFQKVSSSPLKVQDQPLWEEYGLQQAEQAEYASGARHWKATAARLQDPTAAFAAFELTRPAGSKPSALTDAAAETQDGVLLVFGNYLVGFEGWKPKLDDIALFLSRLPGLDRSPLPPNYLPATGLIPATERYVLGPTGLERFEPGVPPSVAAFSMGAEVQIAQYDTRAGRMQLAVFSYPTPQIARQRLDAFAQLPSAMAKRAGPLVAVLLAPKDPDEAEKLLAQVKYTAIVTESQRIPTRRDNIGDLFMNIFLLVGIILAVIIPAGIMVGVLRRLGWGTSQEALTALHIENYSHQKQPAGPNAGI